MRTSHPIPTAACIRAAAHRRLPDMLHDLEQLVRCESPSSAPAALQQCSRLVEDIVHTRVGRRPDERGDPLPHLRWRWPGGPTPVLLLTHFDTVWPLGTTDTFPFTHQGGVVRGPGSFDMKAGLVIAVHALSVLREVAGPQALAGVRLLATADEEVGSHDSRALIQADVAGCRAALVFEGAGDGGALKTARKGTSHYVLRVHGHASHAGLAPELGRNAALDASRLTIAAAELSDPPRGTTVTPTVVTAGSARNTVPELAEVVLDVRVAHAHEQQRVDRSLRRLVAQPSPLGCDITLSGGPNRPPLVPEMSRDLFAAAQQVGQHLGLPPLQQVSVGGGSDGNFTAAWGVPTLDGLGAVGGGAHARDEHVQVAALTERVALVCGLLHQLTTSVARQGGGGG